MEWGEEEYPSRYEAFLNAVSKAELESTTQTLIEIARDPTWLDYIDFETFPEDKDAFEFEPRLSTPNQALRILCLIGMEADTALEPLTPALLSPDEALVEDVAFFFVSRGELALPYLEKLLSAPNPSLRAIAGDTIRILSEEREEYTTQCLNLLLTALRAEQEMDVATCFVANIMDVGTAENLPDLREAYAQGRVDEELLSLEEVEAHFDSSIPNLPFLFSKPNPQEREEEEEEAPKSQPYVAEVKVGRNDPCPCGSGKKYKKCCGA
jgi:HEAT repeat protein